MTSHPPDIRSLRVLVVEDDDDHAELILHVLREHHRGHRVERVPDGGAAIEYLDAHRAPGLRPELVLLDLKLPRVGGIGVLEYIKRDPALQSIPVVDPEPRRRVMLRVRRAVRQQPPVVRAVGLLREHAAVTAADAPAARRDPDRHPSDTAAAVPAG